MLYVTTRQLPTKRRQYEVGDLVDTTTLTDDELAGAVRNGSVVPCRFLGTAAELARQNPIVGPGQIAFETDTGVLKIGTDGATRYNSLTQVGSGTFAALSEGGTWTTSTAYTLGKIVTQAGGRYVCVVAHTSGTFATDLAALKWTALEAVAPLGSSVSTTKTSTFVAAAGNTYFCDASGGAFSVECPPGSAGDAFRVVNTGATGTVTLIPPSGSPGGSNILLTSQYQVCTVECIAAGSWIGGV